MNTDLIDAYRNTRYRVPEQNLEILIGEKCHNLDELLLKYNCEKWAFITPFNPESKILSEEENELRLMLLKKKVASYIVFGGEGVGIDKKWPSEKSLLILDVDKIEAENIGRSFNQNAIVFGYIHKPAELIILR